MDSTSRAGRSPSSFETAESCGVDLAAATANFQMKTAPWDSLLVLADLSWESIQVAPRFVEELQSAFWIELATEYDAENFCRHLEYLETNGRFRRSDGFLAFEAVWRRDELNHTLGFARIFSTLYRVSEEELFSKLRRRPIDFSGIDNFLADEFSVCVVLAFDELATTRSYQRDLVHRYPAFGNPALVEWIRLVARDEAWHFENVSNVIRANHPHRVPELPAFLDKLVAWGMSEGSYGATFVLDHSENSYSAEFLESCRRIILRRFQLDDLK